jgi:hypothetical protein
MDSTWEYLSSDWYSSSRALAAIVIGGIAYDLGDADAISATFNTSSIDRFRKNTEQRVLGKRVPNQMELTVNLTLTQQNPIMMAAQWVGTADQFVEQEAAADLDPLVIANYVPGQIALLPNFVMNATITAITLAGEVVAPEHYRFDKMAAAVQVSSSAGLAAGSLSITYTVPAILASAKRVYTGIGQGGGVRGGLIVRQVNPYGPRKMVKFSTGLFMPTSADLIGGDEFDTSEFTFAPEADASAPSGFELGWMRDISETVLAI